MESTVIPITRLAKSRNWGYASNSKNALDVEKAFSSSKYPVVSLGDHVTSIAGGLTPRGADYPNEGVLFIRVGNVQPHGLDLSDVAHIHPDLHNRELKRCQLKANDVLLAITGATFGKSCIVPEKLGEANINQHIARIRTRPELNPHYLAIFFNSSLGTKQSLTLSTGGTRPALSYKAIRAARIIFPSRPLQDQIVHIMQNAYAMRGKKLEEAAKLLQGIEDYVLQALGIQTSHLKDEKHFLVSISKLTGKRFDLDLYNTKYTGLLFELQKKFSKNLVTLKSVCQPITSGSTPLGSAYTSSGIPFLRVQNILEDGSVEIDNCLFVSPEFAKSIERSAIQNNDVLMTIVGATIGKCALSRNIKGLVVINQAIARIRVKSDTILNPCFLQIFLNSSVGQIQISALKRPVAQGNLNLRETGQILIPLIPVKEQKEIVDEVEIRRSKAKRLYIEADVVVSKAKAEVERIILEQN